MVKSRRSGRKKKKYFRAVLAILILPVLSGGIVGCTFETQYSKNLKRIFETEYFVCINYEGEDTVTILELTELGKQQEVLVIPETIRGYKVVELAGSIKGWTYGPVQRENYIIHLDNLKKLYLSANFPGKNKNSTRSGLKLNRGGRYEKGITVYMDDITDRVPFYGIMRL